MEIPSKLLFEPSLIVFGESATLRRMRMAVAFTALTQHNVEDLW